MLTNNISTSTFMYLLTLCIHIIHVSVIRAGLACNSNSDCQSKLITPGVSTCENGECTNPFERGCLKIMAEKHGEKDFRVASVFEKMRICNSDDDVISGNKEWCRQPDFSDFFSYDEVRIVPGNWESAVIIGWVYQILLTEVLEVPATMEYGDGVRGRGSFYDRNSAFIYVSSDFEQEVHTALWKADDLSGDCSKTEEPCAHIIPEVWSSSIGQKYFTDGRMLPAVNNGMLARVGYYIPVFTAQKHPELSTLYGLSGNKNRENLASKFKTPITWTDYCQTVNCTTGDDGISSRPPRDDIEGNQYFVENAYKGHFIDPPESDCNLYPDNCTGHVVHPGCAWGTFGESQMYWNNIPLVSRGRKDNNTGYSYSHMQQIWLAANATRNNVLLWWWYPDPMLMRFEKSDFRLHRVDLKRTSRKCMTWRETNIEVCSSDVNARIGADPLGSCDYPVERLAKVFSRSLKTMQDNAHETKRSPAFPFMSNVKVEPYAMDDLFREWLKINIDFMGIDSRHATCKWIYDNIESFEKFIPKNYPKEVSDATNPLSIVAYSLASVAILLVLAAGVFIFMMRHREAIKHAQVKVLMWIVLGLLLISVGALSMADVSFNASCVIGEWSVLLGYTLELVPIFLKLQALYKATTIRNSRFSLIVIASRRIVIYAVMFAAPALIYLILWTSLDMPKRTSMMRFEKRDENNLVIADYSCSSKSSLWSMCAYFWQMLLLLSASIIAYQSRGVMVGEIKEPRYIGVLCYSHLMFLIIRIVVRGLSTYEAISGSLASSCVSLILSLDVLFAVAIYFGPKCYNILTENSGKKYKSSGLASATDGSIAGIARLRRAGVSAISKNTREIPAEKS